MSPSPPRAPRAACLAASMGGVSIHGVASKMSPLPPVRPPCCLCRHINGRSESPRRGERHQHRVRVLDIRQQHHKLVVLHRNVTVVTPCPPSCLRGQINRQKESPRRAPTNIGSASWPSTSSATNSLYCVENVTIASSA
ncbi:hypothetical protein PR001_g29382 [Phytophthora rubi]|uniref:Uncharacterized protein n=1 Tax=Phytophthora rubi TaxID=129364 RepID=A0A6A3H2E2_9STRA|nr:hypothetical protein PR001_g29382 [Phytophthora rubi]